MRRTAARADGRSCSTGVAAARRRTDLQAPRPDEPAPSDHLAPRPDEPAPPDRLAPRPDHLPPPPDHLTPWPDRPPTAPQLPEKPGPYMDYDVCRSQPASTISLQPTHD